MSDWLNYHHLRYFMAIIEEGGVTAAAKQMGVSHPTVSEQLHKLEEDLGLKLFERRGRQLELTEDGRMVQSYAEQIFGIGSSLLAAVDARHKGRAVTCRVGIDSVLPKLTVRQHLSEMMDHFGEQLYMRCLEDERERLLEQLAARRLDVVLSDTPAHRFLSEQELATVELGSCDLAFFGAPSLVQKLSKEPFPRNLDRQPFLLPLTTTRLRREIERWLGEHHVTPVILAEVEDSGLLKAFGQDGRGIFAMPADVSEHVCEQYHVLEVGRTDSIQTRVFAIVNRQKKNRNAAVKRLLAD